jgi:hypothetical protein
MIHRDQIKITDIALEIDGLVDRGELEERFRTMVGNAFLETLTIA